MLGYWKRKNIPYLEPTFPFGNLDNPIGNKKPLSIYFHELHQKIKAMGLKYAGIYQYFSPLLMVVDPVGIRHILTKDFQYFQDRGFFNNQAHQPISANLFTMDGEKWKTLRVKFTPTFTSAKMKLMFSLMVEANSILEKHVADHATKGKLLDVKDCITRVSSNIIGTCAFGIECNSFQDATFQIMLKKAMNGATSFLKISFCNALPELARFLRVNLIPTKEGRFICDTIEDTIKFRVKNSVTRNDFLQLVMAMKDENIIDMDELKAQCILFFLAGYESTANATVFLMFELAKNQDIQRRLHEEVNEVLEKHNGEMTYEAIMSMKYLDMVINETLRKYAPLSFLNRKCVNDYKLPGSDIVIEKGTNILISNYGIHHDPEYYPEPSKFDPERFSEENKAKITPYTYLPFGEGPRYCIGDRFAKQEMKTTITTLVRRHRFILPKTVKTSLKFNLSGLFTVPSGDIYVEVEIIDPADIRQILVKDFQYFRDRGFYNDGRGRKNLVTIEGEKWTILRAKFAPMFASGRMKSMFNLMVDASKLLENYVDDHVASGKVLDLKDTIGRSVMNFIAIYVFGIECNTFDDTTFYKMLKHAVSGTEPFLRMTFCNAFPKLARFLRISFFSDKSLRFITDSVERTMAMELMNNNTMNMDGLKAHCLLFFVGGYDAIANVTTFLLVELALNRDVQQRLRDEIDNTLAEYDGRLTYEGVMKMKYLEMVVCELVHRFRSLLGSFPKFENFEICGCFGLKEETLRKYPAIPYLNRKCVKDYKLPSSGIGIEQGTAMIISNYALHNDPEYFPNPNKFDPERFSEENKSKIVPHTYLPFGEGPRFCIGDRFAKLKIKTIAVNFVRKYRFKLHKMIQTPLVFNPTGLFTTAAEDILFDIENSVK
ncbi:hypothetical protein Trydic_g7108 [Trypoxylus dichotomus]